MVDSNQKTVEQQLNDLQHEFKRILPHKVDAIEELCNLMFEENMNETTVSDCHRMAHSLAGSGGSFGAVAVSSVARDLEKALKQLIDEYLLPSERKSEINELLIRLKTTVESWQPSEISYTEHFEYERNNVRNENRKLIYLVDDDRLFAEDLKIKLVQDDFEVKHFATISDFVAAFFDDKPDAIIMDLVFEEGEIAGADVMSQLAKEYNSIPPVIFISVRSDIQARLAAAKAGAQRYFSKPFDIKKLRKTLIDIIQSVNKDPYHVLIVDDDVNLLKYYETVLYAKKFSC